MITYDEFIKKFKGLTYEDFEERIINNNERYPTINIKELAEILGDRNNVEIIPFVDDGELNFRCFIILQDGILDLDCLEYSELLVNEERQIILKFHSQLINQRNKRSNYFELKSFQEARGILENKIQFLKRLETHFKKHYSSD